MTSFKIFGDKISGPSTCQRSPAWLVFAPPVSSIPGFCGRLKCTYMTRIKLLFVLEMFKETKYLVKPYCDPTSSNKALLFSLGNKNTLNYAIICTDAFGWSYCHVYFQSVNVVSMSGDLLPLNDFRNSPTHSPREKPHLSTGVISQLFKAFDLSMKSWTHQGQIASAPQFFHKKLVISIPLKPDTRQLVQ